MGSVGAPRVRDDGKHKLTSDESCSLYQQTNRQGVARAHEMGFEVILAFKSTLRPTDEENTVVRAGTSDFAATSCRCSTVQHRCHRHLARLALHCDRQ